MALIKPTVSVAFFIELLRLITRFVDVVLLKESFIGVRVWNEVVRVTDLPVSPKSISW